MTEPQRVVQLHQPDTYAAERLGLRLHPKQAAILRELFPDPSVSRRARLSVRKANEVGGTRSVVAAAILYAIEILKAQVISTAGKWLQVQEQLIPALKRFQHLYPAWNFLDSAIKVNGIDRYVGFSTTSGYAQGFHRTEETPLVAIVDEAGLVEPGIFDDIEDRCNPEYFMAIGAPMDPVGTFYDMETKLNKFYTHHHISQMDCLTRDGWWLELADIERKIEKHGRENPFILSNVFGEFGMMVENALISLLEWESCLNQPPEWRPDREQRHGFIDFAAGRNKNVFAARVGNKTWIAKKWTERNTMVTVGECLAVYKQLERDYGFMPEEIEGDADGLGLPIVQRCHEVGLMIREYHGGTAPLLDQRYANRISEAWGLATNKIKNREHIIPADSDLKSQALTRQTKRNSDGKFKLESKEDLAKRGLDSPDEADAVFNAMMPCPVSKPFRYVPANGQVPETKHSIWSSRGTDEPAEQQPIPGAHWG